MALLRTLDGRFFELDDSVIEGKEVAMEDIKDLPPSLPATPGEESGDVEGHWPHGHHHWYNWHNHHWHDYHHHH